jgi:3-hydroxybutyryl-CoA dehydrogenase
MTIRIVAVAGLGLLGRGIAACLLAHGFRVIGFTRTPATHENARDSIARAIRELIARAGFPAALADEWPQRYVPVDTCAELATCDFVIESIAEDPAAKSELFDRIEAAVRPEVPVASNTSALPISTLQRHRRHPERFVGMHWAEPAHVTRFMELIRGEQTSREALDTAAELARQIGKEPSVVQKELPGFIVNRIGYAMYREALHLLATGVADVETIDRSCRNALGMWATLCGPFRWIDLTGGPALYGRTQKRVWPTLSNAAKIPELLDRLIESDARGVANGRGFYDYTGDEARRWEELYREHAWRVRELMNEYFPSDES